MATFGSLLRQHRKACNMSQAALAEAADISVAAVAAYERGLRSAPHPQTLCRISDSLGLTEIARREFEHAGRRNKRPLATGDAPVNVPDAEGLPFESTSFVGRERELGELVTRLRHYRLVTITGAGGIGKTRLAVRAAREMSPAFSSATCYVDLSAVDTEEVLFRRVTSALRVTVSSSAAEFNAAAATLAERSALLVLDNCEHLIHAVGLLVKPILARAPGMRVLLTSRKRSAIQGEGVFRLSPLAVPPGLPASVEEARQFAAIELFEERAQGADQTFVLCERHIGAVADICRRLDGMPLALELAAAKVPLLGLNGLQSQLRERLTDLRTTGADSAPRRRSLRAMIEWSCSLLDDAERKVFYRLSTFADLFCIEDAECVCSDDTVSSQTVADAVESLVEHSLVSCDYHREPPFYRMLEPLREFGREVLDDAERFRLSDRHALWYSTLADEIELVRRTMPMREWSARFPPRTNDILQAIDWAFSRNDVALAGNIIGGVSSLWNYTLRWSEGATLADRVLEQIDRTAYPAVTAKVLVMLSSVRNEAHLVLEAIGVREALGDTRGLVQCYLHLAHSYRRTGDLRAAEREIGKASTAARAIGLEEAYPAISFLTASILTLGERYDEARELLEQSLATCDFRKNTWSYMMGLLAQIHAHLGATRAAADIAVEACDHLRDAPLTEVVCSVTEAVGYLALVRDAAWSRYAEEMLVLASNQGRHWIFVEGLLYIAYALAADNELREAAVLSGFVEQWIDHHDSEWYASDIEIAIYRRMRKTLAELLRSGLTGEDGTRLAREGALSDFASIVKRARAVVSRYVSVPSGIAADNMY